MIKSIKHAKKVQTRRAAAGKAGIAKAVKRFLKREGMSKGDLAA